jgi:hypothetical protein
VALNLQKSSSRQRADFRSAKVLEQRHPPVSMCTSGGLRADEHQLGGMGGMTCGIGQRDHAAKRRAQYDRASDAQDIAERAHVVAPLRQVPAFFGTILASAVAAMIQIDDLRDVGQSRVYRPVDRVVGARAAMKHEQCRLFPHGRTVRDELRALNIEEQPHPVDEYMHGQISLGLAIEGQAA